VPVRTGHGRAGHARVLIPHRDGDAGQQAALLVLDGALDLPVSALREQDRPDRATDQDCEREEADAMTHCTLLNRPLIYIPWIDLSNVTHIAGNPPTWS